MTLRRATELMATLAPSTPSLRRVASSGRLPSRGRPATAKARQTNYSRPWMDVYTANYSARANADAKLRPSSSAASLYSASPSRKELRSRPRPEIAYADEMPRFVGSPMVSSYAAQFLRNSCAIL